MVILLFNFEHKIIQFLILIDLIFCWNLFRLFRVKSRYIFFFHPCLLFLGSFFYDAPFTELGDGPLHIAVTHNYFDFTNFKFKVGIKELVDVHGVTGAIRYLNLGVLPIFLLPQILLDQPTDLVYFYWRNIFGVILISIATSMVIKLHTMPRKYVYYMAIFGVISPSFIELRGAINRYDLLYFGIFLFFHYFIALNKKTSFSHLFILVLALCVIGLSKYALLIPICIFCTYYYIVEEKNYKIILLIYSIALFIAISLFTLSEFLFIFNRHLITSREGGGTFSQLAQLPIVGYAFKYLFALLAPFPWHRATLLTEITYKGNYFLFFMHVCSSLTGLYLLLKIIVHRKLFSLVYSKIRLCIVFGLIMSLSVLGGSTGYHTYLLIYFPFLSPILTIKNNSYLLLMPLLLVFVTESIYLVIIRYY
jgi:hypothetical protein